MNDSLDSSKKKLVTFKNIWLIIPGILSVLGLSSIVSGIVTWYSFLGDIVEVYSLVRNFVITVLFDWWLWFSFPKGLADFTILYSCLMVASKIFIYNSADVDIANSAHDIYIRRNWFDRLYTLIFLPCLFLIILPFLPLLKRSDETNSHSLNRQGADFFWLTIPMFLKFLGYIVGALIILLFINWQILAQTS